MSTYYLHNNGKIRDTAECPGKDVLCRPRPVIVVDPEDRNQAHRLAIYLADEQGRSIHYAMVQGAFRKFADPERGINLGGHLGRRINEAHEEGRIEDAAKTIRDRLEDLLTEVRGLRADLTAGKGRGRRA